MMDTQRLIALIVFSFSTLLLWEAWQKHNAPKTVAATTTAPSVSAPSHAGGRRSRQSRPGAFRAGGPAAAYARHRGPGRRRTR
jgi:YidC/Oxa1 family membrane protein insertase